MSIFEIFTLFERGLAVHVNRTELPTSTIFMVGSAIATKIVGGWIEG